MLTFCHSGPWMGLDFLANAGICFLARAQLSVAMGSLWHLMFEGCVLNLENYLHHSNAPHCSACSGIKMYQLQLGILSNVWELTGKCICCSLLVPFSWAPEKGKSPGEGRSAFVSPLEPLEWFLGIFFSFLGAAELTCTGDTPKSISPFVFFAGLVPNPAENTKSGCCAIRSELNGCDLFPAASEKPGFGGSQELEGQNSVNFGGSDLEDKHRRFCTRLVPGKGGLVDLVQILLFTTAQLCICAKLISLPWAEQT